MIKDAVQTFAACFAATVVLTGCDQPSDTRAMDQAAAVAEEASGNRWIELQAEDGAALTLLGEGDRQLIHLACLGDPSRFEVIGRNFRRYDDEGVVTLGVDDANFAVPVDAESETPGVLATSPISAQVIDGLAGAHRISVVYSGYWMGPYAAPETEVLTRFSDSCRTLAEQASGQNTQA